MVKSNCDFSVDDFICSIENNNNDQIILNTNAMRAHIHTVIEGLLSSYVCSTFLKITHKFDSTKVIYNVSKIDIHVIKQELKTISFLLNNIEYLYDFEDKSKALALIYIYYYLILIDFERIDFVELNSNKGRTIMSNCNIDTINDYFDKLIENLDIYGKSENVLIRDVKNEK